MQVIPAIDIRGGRCVRLYQGDYERETVFSDDPVSVAQEWHRQGAARLHVVDLDGALEGTPANETLIQRITASVPIPVQVGGGIRDLVTIDRVIAAGAARVILGTAAVEDPDLVQAACLAYPDAIVVALDARDGLVAVKGWMETTGVEAVHLASRMAGIGAPRFLYTDIARDGTSAGPNFEGVARLLERAGRPVIASGGVATIEHLQRLQRIGAEATIVGRALYVGSVRLPEALAALAA